MRESSRRRERHLSLHIEWPEALQYLASTDWNPYHDDVADFLSSIQRLCSRPCGRGNMGCGTS